MWLSLLAVILILAITFFQSIHGFFSAFIIAVLSVLAAAAAFGFSETLYDAFLWERMPEYGRAVGLVSIFVLTLLILRTITDRLIRSEMMFPLWVHRVGGLAFGFVTAMIVVGVILIGVQLLPFGRNFMGFEREDEHEIENAIWFKPDAFVVGMINHLSGSALAGQQSFRDVYPNYLLEIGRNRVAVKASSRRSTNRAASMSVNAACLIRRMVRIEGTGSNAKRKVIDGPPVDRQWWAIRLSFDPNALDDDRFLRFTPAQVRLVGRQREGGPTVDAYPIGVNDPNAAIGAHPSKATHLRLRTGDAVVVDPEDSKYQFDVVFEMPSEFLPWFIEFKRSQRIAFSRSRLEETEEGAAADDGAKSKKPPPAKTTAAKARSSDRPVVEERGGRLGGQRAVERNTGFHNKLPRALDRATLREQRASIRSGQITQVDDAIVRLPDVDPTGDLAVSEFWVPKGKRLLQLGQQVTHAGSTAGRALQFTKQSLRQFYITDSTGKQYFPIGEWVMVDDYKDGGPAIEIQYHPEMADEVGGERTVKRRRGIDRRDMKETDPWVFLFLVPPGTELESFSTGGEGRGKVELNLVAPK